MIEKSKQVTVNTHEQKSCALEVGRPELLYRECIMFLAIM